MAIITGIVPSPDHPGHVVILVDGAAFATVPVAMAERLALAEGGSPDGLPPALSPSARKTYDRALGLLAFRACSARELRRKLVAKGEPGPDVEAAVARLLVNGLLNDKSFAESIARSGVVGRARSTRRLQHDLARRGVAPAVAAAAVTQVLADEGTDEAAVAERAARKKLRSLANLDPAAQRQKLYGYLARQGYSFDAVRRALRVVLDAAPPEDAEDD